MKALALLFAGLVLTAPCAHAQIPACHANQISVTFDDEGGNFHGMNQSGTVLVLRNYGSNACSVPGRPSLTFLDDAGKPLQFNLQVPPGMHPGPVIVPVVIPASAEATATLHWVSGAVFDDAHHCGKSATVSLTLGPDTVKVPYQASFCSPQGKPATYTQTFLQRDPPYKP